MTATPSGPPQVIGIAADDLTGANDSLVQFAGAGWTSRLALGGLDSQFTGSTLATVTDSRALPHDAAGTVTADAVAQLLVAGADRLYVKIDSTMRGSIPGQIDGALRTWRQQHAGAFAVVCPAYPAMGRTVDQGQLRVNGDPVESTSVGRDPVTPVSTSELATLIPGSRSIRLGVGTATEHAHFLGEAAGMEAGTVVVDAVTDDDLDRLAAALSELGPWAVPVGSAGLAAALASHWGADAGLASRTGSTTSAAGRVLIVVSSLHDVSRGQAERLISESTDDDLLVLRPALADVRSRAAALAWVEARELSGAQRVTLLLSPTDRGSTPDALTGAEIAEGLAAIAGVVLTDIILPQPAGTALVLMGGDGARAVLRETAAHSVVVAGALQEGVPVGVVDGGTAHGLRVVTKAGGFGDPDSLTDIVHHLCTPSPLSPEALP
ncbi:four-carbon acid sugar kinase family protein [Arthrobacter flavus]|uniref:Four-carbon acid sugar kinase family protein n=1 Tax=Arthrobacter flavus TaxID=95172 RepID=A0ABW4Q7K7_9MICC